MFLNRIDSDKNLNRKVNRLEVVVNGETITITEEHGRLRIHADCDDLMISCGSRNSFLVIPSNS